MYAPLDIAIHATIVTGDLLSRSLFSLTEIVVNAACAKFLKICAVSADFPCHRFSYNWLLYFYQNMYLGIWKQNGALAAPSKEVTGMDVGLPS